MQPTSANVVTSLGLSKREFLDIKNKNEKERKRKKEVRDREDDKGRFERSCNSCTCIFFFKLLLIKNLMIVMNKMML